jgi:hypothetical protein
MDMVTQGFELPKVSRGQAAQIATDALHFTAERDTYEIDRVVATDELARPRPAAYMTSNVSIDDCWIVYLKRKQWIPVLCSSTIMLVSKDTGHMVYFGGAGDEG